MKKYVYTTFTAALTATMLQFSSQAMAMPDELVSHSPKKLPVQESVVLVSVANSATVQATNEFAGAWAANVATAERLLAKEKAWLKANKKTFFLRLVQQQFTKPCKLLQKFP